MMGLNPRKWLIGLLVQPLVKCYSLLSANVGNDNTVPELSLLSQPQYSLAGPYLVECHGVDQQQRTEWKLYAVDDMPIDSAYAHDDGARAWYALHRANLQTMASIEPTCRLSCDITGHVSTTYNGDDRRRDRVEELHHVLGLVLLRQRTGDNEAAKKIDMQLQPWQDMSAAGDEIVDMVDRNGIVLGHVPRLVVHRHNLLHRGVGILVSKNVPITHADDKNNTRAPALYVHRRVSHKRIFPNLYDMFVGGVSLAGEMPVTTATREVAEELGLQNDSHLSNERLLQCVVCTSYNRCVVDLFTYTMDSTTETISWQPTEVAWGAFVPYNIVAAAAYASIQRLVECNDWPSSLPAIKVPSSPVALNAVDDTWSTWDFVPDGLLVWEAWLRNNEKSR